MTERRPKPVDMLDPAALERATREALTAAEPPAPAPKPKPKRAISGLTGDLLIDGLILAQQPISPGQPTTRAGREAVPVARYIRRQTHPPVPFKRKRLRAYWRGYRDGEAGKPERQQPTKNETRGYQAGYTQARRTPEEKARRAAEKRARRAQKMEATPRGPKEQEVEPSTSLMIETSVPFDPRPNREGVKSMKPTYEALKEQEHVVADCVGTVIETRTDSPNDRDAILKAIDELDKEICRLADLEDTIGYDANGELLVTGHLTNADGTPRA